METIRRLFIKNISSFAWKYHLLSNLKFYFNILYHLALAKFMESGGVDGAAANDEEDDAGHDEL